MMDARTQDRVARALASALKQERMVAARKVYAGTKLDRYSEPGPHELLAILVGAGVEFYPLDGVVDERQLRLLPKDEDAA